MDCRGGCALFVRSVFPAITTCLTACTARRGSVGPGATAFVLSSSCSWWPRLRRSVSTEALCFRFAAAPWTFRSWVFPFISFKLPALSSLKKQQLVDELAEAGENASGTLTELRQRLAQVRNVPTSAARSAAEAALAAAVQTVNGQPCALGLGCVWFIRFFVFVLAGLASVFLFFLFSCYFFLCPTATCDWLNAYFVCFQFWRLIDPSVVATRRRACCCGFPAAHLHSPTSLVLLGISKR